MNRIKVTPTNPQAVMYDPTSGRLLPPEGDYFEEHSFWIRRESAKEVTIERESDRASVPTGREPLTPMTTR